MIHLLRAHPIQKHFTRAHVLLLLGYGALLLGFAAVIWLALADLAGDYADYAAAADILDRIEGRKPRPESLARASPARRFSKGGP
jgi:hypothetical protein